MSEKCCRLEFRCTERSILFVSESVVRRQHLVYLLEVDEISLWQDELRGLTVACFHLLEIAHQFR